MKNIVLYVLVSHTDTVLEFEEPNYSIKLSFGRKGKVFKFITQKTAIKAKEKDETLEFEKQPESYNHFTKEEYSFKGNYSLEYVPGRLSLHNTIGVYSLYILRYPTIYYVIKYVEIIFQTTFGQN